MQSLFLVSPLLMHLLFLPLPALRLHSISFFYLAQLFNTTCVLLGLKTKRSPEQLTCLMGDGARAQDSQGRAEARLKFHGML